jgi:hypothetical protein
MSQEIDLHLVPAAWLLNGQTSGISCDCPCSLSVTIFLVNQVEASFASTLLYEVWIAGWSLFGAWKRRATPPLISS